MKDKKMKLIITKNKHGHYLVNGFATLAFTVKNALKDYMAAHGAGANIIMPKETK